MLVPHGLRRSRSGAVSQARTSIARFSCLDRSYSSGEWHIIRMSMRAMISSSLYMTIPVLKPRNLHTMGGRACPG